MLSELFNMAKAADSTTMLSGYFLLIGQLFRKFRREIHEKGRVKLPENHIGD